MNNFLPVIELSLSRLGKFARGKILPEAILDFLPYLGLDIEDHRGDSVFVEYSPNRPDFSSEAGIARSMVGLLGLEIGLPSYSLKKGRFKIKVEDDDIKRIRPYIFSIESKILVSDELLRQLIVMQEDLHNGLGRHRSKVAIGLHNGKVIKGPIRYFATRDQSLSFTPLGFSKTMTISKVLSDTEQGVNYSRLVAAGSYPLLIDSDDKVLSMPPVINGEQTRLVPGVEELFVDITATERPLGETAAAIIATMLADNGAQIRTVEVEEGLMVTTTPDLTPNIMRFDLGLANNVLGLELSWKDAESSLGKSRLELTEEDKARIPKFRNDIIHPIDLVEEIALGLGISNFTQQEVSSALSGSFLPRSKRIGLMIDALVGLGLTEVSELSLTSEKEALLAVNQKTALKVKDSKSQNYQYLKSELIPSLLSFLASNIHEEYPQRLFEQAPVVKRSHYSQLQVGEEEHVAAAIASVDANYTQIRSLFDAFANMLIENASLLIFEPTPKETGVYAAGRSARIGFKNKEKDTMTIGYIGEISPSVLDSLGLKMPSAAFELNVEYFA